MRGKEKNNKKCQNGLKNTTTLKYLKLKLKIVVFAFRKYWGIGIV